MRERLGLAFKFGFKFPVGGSVHNRHFSSLESMLCKECIDRVECGPCSQCLCDCFSDNVIFEMALQVAAKVARITLAQQIFFIKPYFSNRYTIPKKYITNKNLHYKMVHKSSITNLPNYKIQLPAITKFDDLSTQCNISISYKSPPGMSKAIFIYI